MTFEQYQEQARRTQNTELTRHQRYEHSLHGLASEVGEIHGIYQKYYQGHSINREEVIEEVGDLLWFIAELCDCVDVNMGDVASRNISKLRARYPQGFSEYDSLHREV